ncbi:MAG: transcription elongation factor GreA [Limnochordaceae bacterium]|nr:transcription elongation factor GreA [Limnochordaceae bacterium]
MAEKEVLLTSEGLQKLEEELDYLKRVKRREVAARIKQALEFGDISENSEYDDAKNEQAFVEGRILQLEKMLSNARLVSADGKKDEVTIGSRVRLVDLDSKEEVEYRIVGSAEANPAEAKISNESPVGRALMGHRVQDEVQVQAPAGLLRFRILAIE